MAFEPSCVAAAVYFFVVCLGAFYEFDEAAVSYYAGSSLLTVDRSLVEQERVFFSRQPEDIVSFVSSAKGKEPDFERCKEVQGEVMEKVETILKKL